MSIQKLYTLLAAVLTTSVLCAQYTSTAIPIEDDFAETNKVTLKPRVGLDFGTLTFYGDIGKGMGHNNMGTGTFAYKLSVANEITSYLDMKLYALWGEAVINEVGPLYRNFSSAVRSGGVSFSYNFGNFLSSDRNIQPYISLGFESVEFLTKTDLKDADGNSYHYWSNGSIMDMDENDPNAAMAKRIYRDYIYETDLRDMDMDGFGKYPERSLSIPVGVGVEMLLTDRVHINFGGEMHFLLNDLMDNTTAESLGDRKGDAQNDRLFFAHTGISYDLSISKTNTKDKMKYLDEDGNWADIEIDMDGDKDGVSDLKDEFFGAPDGTKSDKRGVPIDTDKDGVADYKDEEPNTDKGNLVNNEGVTVTDDELYQAYLMRYDSIPYTETKWNEDYLRKSSDPMHWSNSYSVQITSTEGGLTQSEINLILSYKNLKTVNNDGEMTYFIGKSDNISEAVATKMSLNANGLTGTVVFDNGKEIEDMSEEAYTVEQNMKNNPGLAASFYSDEVVYRIQIGAYKYELSENIFKSIDDLLIIKGDDGLTRYASGGFSTETEAAAHKIKMHLNGFDDSFVTAYKSGSRITLAEAGMQVHDATTDITTDIERNGIDVSLVLFKVQVGSFDDLVPTETLQKFFKIGNIRAQKGEDGKFHYLSGEFDNPTAAHEHMKSLKKYGLEYMEVVGSFNGAIIPENQAKKLIADQ